MAEYLASIFGTEKDKVNCSFYFKIGACRHGERCSRLHNKPTFSQTIVMQNIFQNPQHTVQLADGSYSKSTITCGYPSLKPAYFTAYTCLDEAKDDYLRDCYNKSNMSDEDAQKHFDHYYEDIFVELEEKYGEIEEMNVCDNLGDHLVGNVYVKFRSEEHASAAVNSLNNRWFNGNPIFAELSPVTDFREACCRQYEMGECTRGGFCNFMHLKPISRSLRKKLYGHRHITSSRSPTHLKNAREEDRDVPVDRDRERNRDRDRDRHRRRERDRDYE
ncbi:Splicing factor U2AF 26 kDa subunit [Trichoplax sp. H2]|nr:Splicing factor U2AF 26 kDa subunit [Trichoplax sp. H2]|eukprot:RDD41354.1 Splicing factor U2AF 26 kDa subunit [Trichoplax sp. H2]